ncbi:MAG: SDR family oxidoreductase [Alphaproteobacteria bacterium]|nr:SDR family oxidoreductase [Alphaproteobacteria bacterium]
MFRPGLMQGQKILVTGGGTGLGREMADEFASLGADVVICGRRGPVLEEAAKEMSGKHGVSVTPIACDIRVAEAVEDMVAQAFTGKPVTGLVNNAAGNFISRTKDLSPRGFNAIADIVFRGTFYTTLACGKRWIETQTQGNVVSILTTWVWNGGPFTVPSAMSKAGINIMTKSLAVEWAPHHIRLNAIAPGPFPTKGMSERINPSTIMGGAVSEGLGSGNPMGRAGEMQELRNLAVFLMAPGVEYLTGETIAIDGGSFLANGGNFSRLSTLGDEQWTAMREAIRGANEKDKAQRSV